MCAASAASAPPMSSSGSSSDSFPFYKTPWFEWLAMLSFVGVATWLLADFEWPIGHHQPPFTLPHAVVQDPSHLIETARQLADGHGYAGLKGSVPLSITPPLVPIFLAALMRLSEDTTLSALSPVLFWVNVACVGIAGVFVFRSLTRWLPSPFPLVIAALLTLAPCTLLEVTHLDLTLPFLALSAFTMWLADKRLHAGALSRWELGGCTLWAIACAMVHPAGWAVLLAFIVASFLKQGKSAGMFVSLLSSVLCLPWVGFLVWQLAQGDAFHSQIIQRPAEALHHGHLWATHAIQATLHPALGGRASMAWQVLPDFSGHLQSHNVWQQFWHALQWISSNAFARWGLLTLSAIGVLSKLKSQAGMPSLFIAWMTLGVMILGLGQTPTDDYALWPWLLAAPIVGLFSVQQMLQALKVPTGVTQGVNFLVWGLLGVIALGHLQSMLEYPQYRLANAKSVQVVVQK